MRADESMLARFLSEADRLPRDVRAWATAMVYASLPARQRSRERDRLVRAAAALLPAAPPWTRAGWLAEEIQSARQALPADPDPSTPRGLLAAALLLSPGRAPLSRRTIWRALTRRT